MFSDSLESLAVLPLIGVEAMLLSHLVEIVDRAQVDDSLNQPVRIEQVAVQQLAGYGAHFAVKLVGRPNGQNAPANYPNEKKRMVSFRRQTGKSVQQMTYSAIDDQMANAVRSKISLPSIKIKSHTRSTQLFGRHVQNSVKNHCIVNTLMMGGSSVSEYGRTTGHSH